MKIAPRLRPLWIFAASLSSFLLSGCFINYYKASPVKSGQYGPALQNAVGANRYFVFHQGGKAYGVTAIQLDESSQELSLTVDTIPSDHLKYVREMGKREKTYKKRHADTAVLTEVHLYTIDSFQVQAGSTIKLPITKLQKLEILQHDKNKTTTNHILSVVGVTLGAFTLVSVIVLLTKSSCPFVSGYVGGEFKLQGEIFGGAIYPQLQRHDFLPLALEPVNDELKVRISNELLERQYTDMAELWCIDHDPSIKVVQDEQGKLYSISNTIAPRSAVAAGVNLMNQLENADDRYFDFSNMNKSAASQVNLSFERPPESSNALLVLRLKNSYWIDLTYGEMIKNFGSYYNTWSAQQKNTSVSQIQKWKQEQMLPLKIEMKTGEGWQEVASLETIGPVAFRDLAVPLNLGKVNGRAVELRLSTGFMFWELDHASISYDKQQPFLLHKQLPLKAYDENGKDVQQELMSVERKYLYQPVPGNVATIHFKSPSLKPGMKRSYLLHASGYYEHVRSFEGSPKIKTLKKFREAGALSRLSYERYQQALTGMNHQ